MRTTYRKAIAVRNAILSFYSACSHDKGYKKSKDLSLLFSFPGKEIIF